MGNKHDLRVTVWYNQPSFWFSIQFSSFIMTKAYAAYRWKLCHDWFENGDFLYSQCEQHENNMHEDDGTFPIQT